MQLTLTGHHVEVTPPLREYDTSTAPASPAPPGLSVPRPEPPAEPDATSDGASSGSLEGTDTTANAPATARPWWATSLGR